ncbi:30S ribosomal protein S16 [Bythopirellula polymerisocia]|uniref:30S ribosomal protein S16 n=1 Tax=Bythopirellula polymerisocia TaxID=2528003 RepID=UPI001E382DDE|nr:30S ribosomal protein S16 [Bythopirellula polymerisocia]
MAVRIRLKKMGRTHRPFFRVCAFDQNAPRDGKALEELGVYDTSVPETDARAILNGERIAYWLGVGAQPTEKVAVLIKKYGKDGTHLAQQQEALANKAQPKVVPDPGAPASLPKKKEEEPAPVEAAAEEAPTAEAAPAEPAAEASAEEQPTDAAAEETAAAE